VIISYVFPHRHGGECRSRVQTNETSRAVPLQARPRRLPTSPYSLRIATSLGRRPQACSKRLYDLLLARVQTRRICAVISAERQAAWTIRVFLDSKYGGSPASHAYRSSRTSAILASSRLIASSIPLSPRARTDAFDFDVVTPRPSVFNSYARVYCFAPSFTTVGKIREAETPRVTNCGAKEEEIHPVLTGSWTLSQIRTPCRE